MPTKIFGEPRMKSGEGKARVCALKMGDILKCDDWDKNKWATIGNQNGIRLARVPGGMKRVG